MPLTTIATVKKYMDLVSDATWDNEIGMLIQMVDDQVKKFLGRDPEQNDSISEFFDGNEHRDLFLTHTPVRSITNVWDDSDGYYGSGTNSPFATSDLLVSGIDYVLVIDDSINGISESGIVRRLTLNLGWTLGIGNIKVQYAGGYTRLPDDIVLAATMQVAELTNKIMAGGASSGPIESERLGDYSVSLAVTKATVASSGLVGLVQSLLQPYRHLAFTAFAVR